MDTFEFDSVLISPIIEILDLGTEKLLTPLQPLTDYMDIFSIRLQKNRQQLCLK